MRAMVLAVLAMLGCGAMSPATDALDAHAPSCAPKTDATGLAKITAVVDDPTTKDKNETVNGLFFSCATFPGRPTTGGTMKIPPSPGGPWSITETGSDVTESADEVCSYTWTHSWVEADLAPALGCKYTTTSLILKPAQ
jgi:hypothetical protein